MNWLTEARGLGIPLLRRDLHRIPEIGNREEKTSAYIEAYLKCLGIRTERVLETAVIGTLGGNLPGPVVALRADMDALPLEESTEVEWRSLNEGMMHACGHDVHMASVLGAAALLSGHRDSLKGTVKFIFQPDEEGRGGAQRIIDTGVLDGVSAVFGGHVAPDLPFGTIGIRYGKFYAASDVFTVTITGKSSHGATPEKGRNALLAAAEAVCRLSGLRREDDDKYVLSVGKLESGYAENIIADKAVFSGILRTLGAENRREMKERMREAIEGVMEKYGTEAEVSFRESYGGVVNTEDATRRCEEAAVALVGREGTIVLQDPTMTTEDFGCYVDRFSGSFVHFGVGGEEPLHSPRFLPPEETPVYGAAFFASLVAKVLC